MRHGPRVAASLFVTIAAASVLAQTPDSVPKGPKPGDPQAQFFPDPTHIPFFRPEDVPWQGGGTSAQRYNIFGDPGKPGPYAQMLRWNPGAFSKPHFHDNVRYVVVVSGTWWVSASTTYDPAKTYPLGPGSVVSDVAKTVHWDGAKDEPVVLIVVGDGPSPNINVGEDGKPLPPRARAPQ